MNRRPLAAAAALVLVTSLTACAGERGPGGAELAGDEITVFAAASLSIAFEEIAADAIVGVKASELAAAEAAAMADAADAAAAAAAAASTDD